MSDDDPQPVPMVPFDPRRAPQEILLTALPGEVFLLVVMPQMTLQVAMSADEADGLADRIKAKAAQARATANGGLTVVESPLTVEQILNPPRP